MRIACPTRRVTERLAMPRGARLRSAPRASSRRRRVDLAVAGERAEPAIGAGDDTVGADDRGVALDALRDQLRVSRHSSSRCRSGPARASCRPECSASRQTIHSCSWRGLAASNRIVAGPRLEHDGEDLLERDVVVMRAFVVAPADVHAHALGRDVRRGGVERLDIGGDGRAGSSPRSGPGSRCGAPSRGRGNRAGDRSPPRRSPRIRAASRRRGRRGRPRCEA